MANTREYPPPKKRKEPGLIGKLFSALIQLCVWLVISLILSIVIEWIGMRWFWPEQGADHAKKVFMTDQNYLNDQLRESSLSIKNHIVTFTNDAATWVENQSGFNALFEFIPSTPGSKLSGLRAWGYGQYARFDLYLQASSYVTQTFVIRLALILFSLPLFCIAMLVGAIDGLVERDLRRWGGGRESSNVFNLARSSVVPSFVMACVVYISLPFSVHPGIVILPFALLFGLAVRIAFERLKKYF